MTIMMDETIRAIWFYEVEPQKVDYMGGLNETPDGLIFKYRFRYWKSEAIFSKLDESHWYRLNVSKPLPEAISGLRAAIAGMAEVAGRNFGAGRREVTELIRGDKSLDAFVEEFRNLPFVHRRYATPQENAEIDELQKAGKL